MNGKALFLFDKLRNCVLRLPDLSIWEGTDTIRKDLGTLKSNQDSFLNLYYKQIYVLCKTRSRWLVLGDYSTSPRTEK